MRYFSILISIVFLCSCTDQTKSVDTKGVVKSNSVKTEEVKCKYGQPVAIFSEKLEAIKKQSFEVNGQKGVETVEFEDGRYLELFQSGCNEIRQEYRFTLKGEYKDKKDNFWFEEAINQLTKIGQMDERYAVIGIWVGALERIYSDMTIGQFAEAEPNTFIMVDRIVESGSSMVIIVLEARTPN